MTQISAAITNLFKKHRIVFWYDYKRELRTEFETLILPGIEVIELSNNEFAIKHRILREKPDGKFLIYQDGPPPNDIDNWMLDVQLAQGEFRADQTALWLSDLELGLEYVDLVQSHIDFFSSELRRIRLKTYLDKRDSASTIRIKMLAICANTEPRLDEVLEALLDELAHQQHEKIDLIIRCGLDAFFWERLDVLLVTNLTPQAFRILP
jgi:hypothetical protein